MLLVFILYGCVLFAMCFTGAKKDMRQNKIKSRKPHKNFAILPIVLYGPPIEFDDKLWHAVVDCLTVYNDDRLVYSLKDGSEITVML